MVLSSPFLLRQWVIRLAPLAALHNVSVIQTAITSRVDAFETDQLRTD